MSVSLPGANGKNDFMATLVKAVEAVATVLEIVRRKYAFYRKAQEKATKQEAKDFLTSWSWKSANTRAGLLKC